MPITCMHIQRLRGTQRAPRGTSHAEAGRRASAPLRLSANGDRSADQVGYEVWA